MSNQNNDEKGYSFGQIVLATLAGVIGMAAFIFIWAKAFGITEPIEVAPPVATVSKVDGNIKPVATVEVASSGGAKTEKSGEEVVKAVCSMCHGAGLMGAPKIGDKGQWAPRIAQGYETLIKNAINGIRSMPARGGNPALTDNEIASAVANMANASGANFKVAAPKAAEESAKPADAAVPASDAKPTEAVAAGKSGEEVYKGVCSMCHAAGLMNAPKFGDKALWEPRIKQGYDTLVNNAVKGIRTMPAKGGNAALSDAEVAGAVKYMANAAGAGF